MRPSFLTPHPDIGYGLNMIYSHLLTKLEFDKRELVSLFNNLHDGWLRGDPSVEITKWRRRGNQSTDTINDPTPTQRVSDTFNKIKLTYEEMNDFPIVKNIIEQLPPSLILGTRSFSFVRFTSGYKPSFHCDDRNAVVVMQLSENPLPGEWCDDNKNVIYTQDYTHGYAALCEAKTPHRALVRDDEDRLNFQLGVRMPWNQAVSILTHLM